MFNVFVITSKIFSFKRAFDQKMSLVRSLHYSSLIKLIRYNTRNSQYPLTTRSKERNYVTESQKLETKRPNPSSSSSSTATASKSGNAGTTHFGFETIKESEKTGKVHKVFEDVAKKYDLMNDAMSMGVHRIWKDIFIERLGPVHGMKLLDMAGGTGDIAFRYLKYLKNQPNPRDRSSHVSIADINQNMLDVGQERARQRRLTKEALHNITIEWDKADAEDLPFADNCFSAYTIAFGIRNCTHIDKVLKEAYRVLQPGGRFLCLEFSHLTNETLQRLYDQYSFQVIPPMGQILAGQWKPYKYLVESIRKFPKQDDFKAMIQAAGFEYVQYENLTFGVVSIHSGFKL